MSQSAKYAFPIREMFALDLRSLALFRFGLGVFLILEWIDRARDLRAHYTDDGIFPRSALTGLHPISLHVFGGSVGFQAALFAASFVLAALLLVGRWTPIVTFLNWVMVISVHARVPAVMQGGDHVLRMVLFWSIFLPLGACWSFDSALDRERPKSYRWNSIGAVAFIVQLCLVYLFAAAWKWGPEWRENEGAVYLALQLDFFATRFAEWLRQFPYALLRLITRATVWLEALGPAVLFLPFSVAWQRLLVISAFMIFHIGLAISLELSGFPWICVVAWAALLPGAFWDKVQAHYRVTGLTLRHDPARPRAARSLSRLRTFLMLDEAPLEPAAGLPQGWAIADADGEHTGADALRRLFALSPVFFPFAGVMGGGFGAWLASRLAGKVAPPRPERTRPRWLPPGGAFANLLCGLFLVYVVLWNVRTFGTTANTQVLPNQMTPVGQVLAMEQGWGLFAPGPGRAGGWHMAAGECEDGSMVDALNGGPLTWDKPARLAETYPNGRWRKMLMNLPEGDTYPFLQPGLSRYLLRKWNDEHKGDRKLKQITLYWMREVTVLPGEEAKPAEKLMLIRYTPGPAPEQRWFVVAGVKADGSKIDLLRQESPPVDWRKPTAWMGREPISPWHAALSNLKASGALPDMLPGFAKHQLEEYNRRRDSGKLTAVEVYEARADEAAPDGVGRELLTKHPGGK